ncbi:zinc finger protein 271-like [Anopheles bellator]|uniref:zinc finger protein 271-like n=1 Tax=Anopheles bellator TaxID=139047 RepID=UPI00264997E0|nr:zinc finger protein 271-like [Anopheles bellator]
MESKEALELSVTPEELCRTCLAAVPDRSQLKPIFCSEILDGKIVPFPKVLELVIGAKFVKDEKLPNNVCIECKAKVRDLYVYVSKVRNSVELLYDIFGVAKPAEASNVIVKAEPPKKIDTRNVEVQTDAIEAAEPPQPKTVETGTQCDPIEPTPRSSLVSPREIENKRGTTPPPASKKGVSSHLMNLRCGESSSEIRVTVMEQDEDEEEEGDQNEGDSKTDNEQALVEALSTKSGSFDHDEYEIQLVSEEPETDECLALSVVEKVGPSQLKGENGKESSDENVTGSFGSFRNKSWSAVKREPHDSCTYCDFTSRATTFVRHFLIHKQTLEMCFESIDYFRCSLCFTVFISQSHFEEHFDTTCASVAQEEYTVHEDLLKHETFYQNGLDICVPKLKTFKRTDARFRCGRCCVYQDTFEDMRLHCQTHEVEDDHTQNVDLLWRENMLEKVHVCGICGAHFPDAMFIRQHLYFHQTAYFCAYDCSQTFDDFHRLTKHISRKHYKPAGEETTAEFFCDRCPKSFSSTESLKTHVKNHLRERKYVCCVCSKRFVQKSDLIIHGRTHTDERPYECRQCSKRFRTASHLRDHMSTHEEVNKFECDVCHKLFKAERILAGHRQLHTGLKPYACDICSKTFVRKQHLKLHAQTHSRSSPPLKDDPKTA